jgi:hypothetical protein
VCHANCSVVSRVIFHAGNMSNPPSSLKTEPEMPIGVPARITGEWTYALGSRMLGGPRSSSQTLRDESQPSVASVRMERARTSTNTVRAAAVTSTATATTSEGPHGG